jgi:hypothetical protein
LIGEEEEREEIINEKQFVKVTKEQKDHRESGCIDGCEN